MEISNLSQEIAELHARLCLGLADSTRLLILYLLFEKPCNVGELTEKLSIPQSNVSRHLRLLRDGGLVRATRQGANVQYELTDVRVIDALDILRTILRDQIQRSAEIMEEIKPLQVLDPEN
jgi:DNA-binding transcriptional ArsR family regulator